DIGAEIDYGGRRSKTHPWPTSERGHGGRIVVLLSNADVGADIDHTGRGSMQHPHPTCEGGHEGRIVVHPSNGTRSPH
ncbi:unnamed protein product, partial [Ectocarpus sp. 12 AP-2014]